MRSFAGAKAVHHAASEIGRKIHPGGIEGVEVLREAPAGMPGAMQRPEHAERTGKGYPEVSSPSPPAPIAHDHRGPDPERLRDRLSLSGIYRGRFRRHPANVLNSRTAPFDLRKRGRTATGRARTPRELRGHGIRDHDPMQLSQVVQIAERVQVDERSRVEDGRFGRFAACLRQEVPNLSA